MSHNVKLDYNKDLNRLTVDDNGTIKVFQFGDDKSDRVFNYVLQAIDDLDDGSSGGGVNADWSENDPEAPSYIQNRTHWLESSEDESSAVSTLFKRSEGYFDWSDGTTDASAEFLASDYSVFFTAGLNKPFEDKTDLDLTKTTVNATLFEDTYSAVPNYLGYEGDSIRNYYYSVGNYNLLLTRRHEADPEVIPELDEYATIVDSSQADWPFCIWFRVNKDASDPTYDSIDVIGIEADFTKMPEDQDYNIPFTVTNLVTSYHQLDSHYIPTAQSIAQGQTGFATGDQVYNAIQSGGGGADVWTIGSAEAFISGAAEGRADISAMVIKNGKMFDGEVNFLANAYISSSGTSETISGTAQVSSGMLSISEADYSDAFAVLREHYSTLEKINILVYLGNIQTQNYEICGSSVWYNIAGYGN